MPNQRSAPRFNPRGGERRPPRPLGAGARPSSPLWYGLALLVVLGIAQMYFLTPAGRSIPYSEFKAFLKSGQVAEVSIADQQIRGTLKQDAGADGKQSRQFTTTRVEDPKLTEELEAKGVKYTGEVVNRWLPDLLGWIIPLLFLVGIWGFFFRRMSGAEGGVMSFARSRAKIYADDEVKVRFADVAGVDEAKDELKEIVEFLQNPKKYTNLGGRIPKGVLLVGPPGTGKTLLARAVAGEAHVPFFSLSGSEFVEMFVGVGAARIRDLFQQAEAKAPCIVFIDELDALGKVRVQSPIGSHEEREQTLNQLLAEMDGFDSRKGVAARTAGFAGADLANLVNEAALLAARNNKSAVGMPDFESAIDRLVAGLEKKRVMSTKERKIVAYHESGHAIVATALPGLDPVHKISIVQRGFGALGYTMQLPLEDRYLMTRGDLLSQLAVLLAGRTAEEIALGEISTGAQNDLQRATDIARAMVTEFGMSDTLGAINYDGNKRARFLDIPMPQERGLYGEETAQKIDAEIKRILTDAHNKAREILTSSRDKLETVTRRLLEIEVMEGDELRKLLGMPPPPPAEERVPLPPIAQ